VPRGDRSLWDVNSEMWVPDFLDGREPARMHARTNICCTNKNRHLLIGALSTGGIVSWD